MRGAFTTSPYDICWWTKKFICGAALLRQLKSSVVLDGIFEAFFHVARRAVIGQFENVKARARGGQSVAVLCANA